MNSMPHNFYRALRIKYIFTTALIVAFLGLTHDGRIIRTISHSWILIYLGYQTVRFLQWYAKAQFEENPVKPDWIHLDIELAIGLLAFLLASIVGIFGLFSGIADLAGIVILCMSWMWMFMMVYYFKMERLYRAFCLKDQRG